MICHSNLITLKCSNLKYSNIILLLYFEGGGVTHMPKKPANATQVLDEFSPTRAGRALPLFPDHAGSMPDLQQLLTIETNPQ